MLLGCGAGLRNANSTLQAATTKQTLQPTKANCSKAKPKTMAEDRMAPGLEITSPRHSNKLYNTYMDCVKTAKGTGQVPWNSVTYARFSRLQAHGGAGNLQRVNTSLYVRL